MSYTEIKYSQPKARKTYNCEWCNQWILKGEKHHYRFYEFNGDKNEGRMHNECWDDMETRNNDDLSEGWMPGDWSRPTKARSVPERAE
jgi:hypothetical protein